MPSKAAHEEKSSTFSQGKNAPDHTSEAFFLRKDTPQDVTRKILDYLKPSGQNALALTHSTQLDLFRRKVRAETNIYKKRFIRHFPYLYHEKMEQKKEAALYHYWWLKFSETELSEYTDLSKTTRKLFSLVKEGSSEYLKECLEGYKKLQGEKVRQNAKTHDTEEKIQAALLNAFATPFLVRDNHGYTLLYWARQLPDLEAREYTLNYFYQFLEENCRSLSDYEQGEPPNFKGYWAIQCLRPLEEIEALLEEADQRLSSYLRVSIPDIPRRPFYFYEMAIAAVEASQLEVLRLLIRQCPSLVNLFTTGHGTAPLDKKFHSIMHAAVRFSPLSATSFPIIDHLLQANPYLLNLRWVGERGNTPVSLAVTLRHINLAEHLLNQPNIEISSQDSWGRTLPKLITRASEFVENKRIISLIDSLISIDPDLLNSDHVNYYPCTPLAGAICCWQEEIVMYLLQKGSPPNYVFLGHDILYHAISSCPPPSSQPSLTLLRTLLTIEPRLLDEKNWIASSPLVYALNHGQTAVAQFLLAQPNVDKERLLVVGRRGNTALHAAISPAECPSFFKCPDLNFIKDLLEINPQLLNAKNDEEETPLFLAISHGYEEVARYLLQQDNVDTAAAKKGATLLHAAFRPKEKGAASLSLTILRRLYEMNPSSLHAKDYKGVTPLELALKQGYKEADFMTLKEEEKEEARPVNPKRFS